MSSLGASTPRWQYWLEALLVAIVVAIWLQMGAEAPTHLDTAVDIALARDCIASKGSYCRGHAASAIGLVQGQGFTYALAAWLYLGLSMSALCSVAACTHGAAAGLIHRFLRRRFGAAAWIVSAFAPLLSAYMTTYPVIWNPSWFILPLTVAFLATLAVIRGGHLGMAALAGAAFAITAESHLLFGTFVAVACGIVLITAARPLLSAGILGAAFTLAEWLISPITSRVNLFILQSWLEFHYTVVTALLFGCAVCVPLLFLLRRWVMRFGAARREALAVGLWLLAGGVAVGLVLPWVVSRPFQIRYCGAAWPAIAFAAAWLLDQATFRRRAVVLNLAATAIFAIVFFERIVAASTTGFIFEGFIWSIEDGTGLSRYFGVGRTSVLDLQTAIRPLPPGVGFGECTAAVLGNTDVPQFPSRQIRVVRVTAGQKAPSGWASAEVRRGAVLSSEIESWTHPENAEVCPEPRRDDSCVVLMPDDWRTIAAHSGGLLHRVFGLRIERPAAQIADWCSRGSRSLSWKIPLRAIGEDQTRTLIIYDTAQQEVVGVQGTEWSRRSQSRIEVKRPPSGADAFVIIRTPPTGKFEAGIPPLPFELRDGEDAVLRDVPLP